MPRALAATVLVINGTVRTMNPHEPLAEAVAIFGKRIVGTGSSEDMMGLKGPSTRVIDARGRLVLPGFNDAHVHFLAGGFSLSEVQLRECRTLDEFRDAIETYARSRAPDEWITGGCWDHERWPGGRLPSRSDLDAVTPANPAFVSRLDGHMGVANSIALRLSGLTRETLEPTGGVIEREPHTGEPTGVLKDAAMDLVTRVIPPKTRQQKLDAARAASRFAASLGVTSVTDMSADADVSVYKELNDAGELHTRIYAARTIVAWQRLAACGLSAPFGNDFVREGGVKGFCDGSLGSSTALFYEPYEDSPGNRGLLFEQMLPEGIMLERAIGADRAGLQLMIHAIGDEANTRILDLYAAVEQKNGNRDRRCRIEHAQHLRTADVARFGTQRVIASMQPFHAVDDGCWCEKRLGPSRSNQAYLFRSLLDAGAVLAFGSDWTVAPLDPLTGIHAAVTRITLDGRNPEGWNPAQKIELDSAVRAYTTGPAFAEFTETTKGTLMPGMLADLVILDRDIYKLPPPDITRARVELTIVDGQVIYEAGSG